MNIIDCSACIGLGAVNRYIVNHENYPVYERVRQAPHAADLLEEMDFCGIGEAFVYHQAMYDTDPAYGNELMIRETLGQVRLHPTWTILPPVTEGCFAPDALLPRMAAQGVRALRAYPQRNRYFLDRVTMGELLDVLCERRIPLFLSPQQQWESIFALLRDFPRLTVILTNYGLWGSDRYFYPLVRAYESVYVDTSDYQVINGLPAFIRRFGSDRLLFGSNFPMDAMGGPLGTLFGSGLRQEDIERIAHGNIERLMGEARI
ncbi:MAG: Amidohydrolase [Syntrophaceae bacterium PtaU1.Bin231]|nr:MAG: Amidohydrolase [Syntrophaceae bacterium PtaU1.Bin231]